MTKWWILPVSASLCILLSSCASMNAQTADALRVEVDTLGNQAEAAFLAGDVDAMLEFYTDDILSMPDGYPMLQGKDNLRIQTEAIMRAGLTFEYLESTTTEVKSDGRYVYEIGTFRQSVTMPGATEPTPSTGKYVTIWQRQPGGDLKIAVEIYNSDTAQ